MPRHRTCVGIRRPAKAVGQEQKILVLVASSTWTSRLITVSYHLLMICLLGFSECKSDRDISGISRFLVLSYA